MRQQKILLVEDNDDDVELTLHAFRQSRFNNEVVVMRNGEDALSYLTATAKQAEMPAFVLLDLQLPGMSGLEVLREARRNDATKRVPMVILTTSDDELDLRSGYNLGVNSYIRKPVDFMHFSELIERLGTYWLVINTPAPS